MACYERSSASRAVSYAECSHSDSQWCADGFRLQQRTNVDKSSKSNLAPQAAPTDRRRPLFRRKCAALRHGGIHSRAGDAFTFQPDFGRAWTPLEKKSTTLEDRDVLLLMSMPRSFWSALLCKWTQQASLPSPWPGSSHLRSTHSASWRAESYGRSCSVSSVLILASSSKSIPLSSRC